MHIVFLTSGTRVPSSRFRVQQYLPYLRAMGHHCRVLPSRPPKYRGWRFLGNRLSDGPRLVKRAIDGVRIALGRPDVVVIERELFSSGIVLMERWVRRLARTLVLDVDDALFFLHPAKFEALVRMSDAVIAGNELLRERIAALNPNVSVLPTCLDLDRFRLKPTVPRPSVPVLGWTGTAGNYPSLRPIIEPLRDVARTHAFQLRLIAERPPAGEIDLTGLDWQFSRWTEARESEDLHAFDVGVMPLDDTEWNRYKCGLKILQYMAVGIPAVASPVGINRQIIHDGRNGFLAESPDDWRYAIVRLLENGLLRQQLGQAGRQTVEQHYCIAAHAPRLVEILRQAIGTSERLTGERRP